MTTALTTMTPDAAGLERVLVKGDLAQLTEAQRVSYYNALCQSLGLNPLTQPFQYLTLNGKLVLYARRDAAEQLRKVHGVSITDVQAQRVDDVYVVTVRAQDKTGRTDASTGAVTIGNLKGEPLANALMKAETKAKRRVTLSICGLGMLDETEVESIPQAEVSVKVEKRITLPEGTHQIVSTQPTRYGGEITTVDHAGVEQTHKTTVAQLVAACEQFAQDAIPVVLHCREITRGKNAGNFVLEAVTPYAPAEPEPLAPVVDAESAVL